MFPYDATIAAALKTTPQSIPEVLNAMRGIDAICTDSDGLKWFNWLYLQVTQAVENRVAAGGFSNSAWLASLDVNFAALYFNALRAFLTGQPCPGCWSAVFSRRNQTELARIQFALAGVNAHINHDLPLAIDQTSRANNTRPTHGTPQYNDYTSLNATLSTLIDEAKKTLHVRLLGDALPPVSHVEDAIASWNLVASREAAWNTAEILWFEPRFLVPAHMAILSALTAFLGKTLLLPAP